MSNILKTFLTASAFMVCSAMFGQNAVPTVTYYSTEDESDVTMSEGESQTCEAPLEIHLNAGIANADGYSYVCEWRIYDANSGDETPILTRFEENTSYTLTTSGSFLIKLYVTFTGNDGKTIEYESDGFTIVISESSLTCPNAFSPNGDGINDVLKITYKSIVKLDGIIFNRWGQKLYSFNLQNVDNGWDGKVHGKYVKDGVYFLQLNAVGSDGVKYNIKKAINVLKGFSENSDSSSSE